MSLRRSALALVAAATFLTGCSVTTHDDETAPPPTPTPSATPTPGPDSIPVGSGKVRPGDDVRVDGNALMVGSRRVDVSPMSIDSFVVVPGGVFFLDHGELWFTDLDQVRGTGLTRVSSLSTSADGGVLRVRTSSGAVGAWDTRTGRRDG